VLIQIHDPAYTEMLEQTAEARHRMAIAEAEAQANHRHEALTGSLKEALQIREAQEINQARMFLRENEENIKSEAVQHVRAHEAQCTEKVQAYQRILDANLRQSMATKESEIERLRSQAAEKERAQEERIKRLEELAMQQSLHNQKLQSMLDSQLSQPPPVQVVETATLTRMAEPYVISAPIPACTVDPPIASEHPFHDPFNAETVPPPYAPPPMLSGPYASNTDGATEDMVTGRIPAGRLTAAPAKKVARREAVPVADVEPDRDPGEFIIHIERDDPPLDIDGFVAEMEELASVDPPKGTPRPEGSRPDVVQLELSGKKKDEDKESSSPPEQKAFVVDFSSKRSQ
ncbi:unnamed protein product, partial [Cladocopium goreaui]